MVGPADRSFPLLLKVPKLNLAIMIDAKHIAPLEAWLKKTREEQNQLIARLQEAEDEVEQLRSQIAALEEVAKQAESMIHSLLISLQEGDRVASTGRRTRIEFADGAASSGRIDSDTHVVPASGGSSGADQPTASNVTYLSSSRPVLLKNTRIEPITNRFSDRTITQACTLLLREAGSPLHVNDLYRLLAAGGMEFKGNNPTISVAVSLNRNRKFKKVGPGTFDLIAREANKAAS